MGEFMNLTDEEIKQIIGDESLSKKMHKITENGLFLSDEEINLLKRYHIDYLSCLNVMQLIHIIDEINDEEESEELESLAAYLSEQYYYNNVNK